ncbi:alkaline phosphatase family protein [Nocardioides piscis]|uniref:Alkaline phosphatase family protein n=1 Tax=Nocardioides piscis TaxID=2714938 RepID=A0A6G7YBL5_9ACTN|nr:alkaline phosphatase family protein [Nocardioides piscis]QIK74066.1 alkaline phosphatase family protein [Nocardioides piscis]
MSRRLPVLLVAAALLVPAGAAAGPATPDNGAAGRVLYTQGPVDTVVAISIDGLNPRAITKLGKRGAPALHKLIRTGATTLNARTALELTDTLPNHTGMVTGRRIEAAASGHGVTWNDDRRRPRRSSRRPGTTSRRCSTSSMTPAAAPPSSPARRSSRCGTGPGRRRSTPT